MKSLSKDKLNAIFNLFELYLTKNNENNEAINNNNNNNALNKNLLNNSKPTKTISSQDDDKGHPGDLNKEGHTNLTGPLRVLPQCYGKHDLVELEIHADRPVTCDGCGSKQDTGKITHTCLTCDVDACAFNLEYF